MKYFILVILCLRLTGAIAQQPADVTASGATTSLPPKETWGKIIGEKKNKSYTTRDGKVTYTIGGTIQIGFGSAEDKSFQYIKRHLSNNKFVKSIVMSDAAPLNKDYEDTKFVVKDIYEGISTATDMFVKDAPKAVFIVFDASAKTPYEAAIEKALKSKEVEGN